MSKSISFNTEIIALILVVRVTDSLG